MTEATIARIVHLAIPILLAALAAPLATQTGFRTETVVTGLDDACAMAFAPDGRLFVVERVSGDVVVVERGVARTWATLPVVVTPFSGLLGIAVDPGFLQNRFVYIALTTPSAGGADNVIARLRDDQGRGVDFTPIGPRIPASSVHEVGPLVFGGDGKLWAHAGDGGDPPAAARIDDPRGKMLRLDAPDGGIPTDNPFPGSWVWSYGHRNSFGLAVHPRSGLVYATENAWHGDDELNRLERGANFGWPVHDGREQVPDPGSVDPLHTWSPQLAPTGCCFYTGSLYPPGFRDGWFVATWNQPQVLHVDLASDGVTVRSIAQVLGFTHSLYAVANAPDGTLWVLRSTSSPLGADRIDRIVHAAAPHPAVALTATSNVAVGKSLTLGVHASDGDLAFAWLGATRNPTAVSTPFGDLWVPLHIALPGIPVAGGDRVFLGLQVPNDARLRGAVIHVQAATVRGSVVALTNAADARLL